MSETMIILEIAEPVRDKVRMSYNELDSLIAFITESETIVPCDKCPSIDEIKKYIEPDMHTNLKAALWVTETYKPKNQEEREAVRYLKRLIQESLDLTDPEG